MNEVDFEKGDRFADMDWRNEGRVIEIDEVLPGDKYFTRTEAHPNNPSAVGKHHTVSGKTLRRASRYRKISR